MLTRVSPLSVYCVTIDWKGSALEKLSGMIRWSILSGYHWKADLDVVQTLRNILGPEEFEKNVAENKAANSEIKTDSIEQMKSSEKFFGNRSAFISRFQYLGLVGQSISVPK